MGILLFSKDFLLLLIFAFIFLPYFIFLIIFLIKKKFSRRKCILCLAVFMLVVMSIPIEKIIDIIPFQFKDVEEAFNFDYGYHYQFAYGKKLKKHT